jgi:hypothetical protein
MSATYVYGDLVNMCRSGIPAVSEEKTVDLLLMKAQTYVWNRFDWRETIAPLPPFWVMPDTQDYGAPAVIVPDDFQGLRKAFMIDVSTYPENVMTLKVLRELSPTIVRSLSDAISFDKATQTFRLSRRPTGGMTAPQYLVNGTYKILPTKITKTNYPTFPIFTDDQYIGVWEAVMRYVSAPAGPQKEALKVAADAALQEMAANEGLNLGETPFAPDESLAAGKFTSGSWGFPMWW